MLMLLEPTARVGDILATVTSRAATTPQLGPEFRYLQMRLGAEDGPIIDTNTTLEELELVPSDLMFALGICDTVKESCLLARPSAPRRAPRAPAVQPDRRMPVKKVHAHLMRARLERDEKRDEARDDEKRDDEKRDDEKRDDEKRDEMQSE